ncbi:hypothetical protein ACHAPA_011915 [Fusarium lateritium]
MQSAIKRYLANDSPGKDKGLGRKPPVPQYGFLLLSYLVIAFPEMVVITHGIVVAIANVTLPLTLKAVVAFSGRPEMKKDITIERLSFGEITCL